MRFADNTMGMKAKKITRWDGARVVMAAVNWAFGSSRCTVCGRRSIWGKLCRECEGVLARKAFCDTTRRCRVCGKRLNEDAEGDMCEGCTKERILTSADRVFHTIEYRSHLKTLLLDWKERDERSLSLPLAKIAAASLQQQFDGEYCLTPVPPRPGKLFTRGWDQVEELSRILRGKFGFKVQRLLRRTSETEQKSLRKEGRLETIGKSYVASGLLLRLQRQGKVPRHVVLMDDIYTTGATAQSCALILKEAGVQVVDVFTLFAVP